MRRALILGIAVIFLIGVSGCMSTNKKLSAKEKEEMVLEHLKNKYNEEFVPLSISQSGWGQGHDVIVLYPKNGNKEDVFQAWGTKMDDGSYSVSDGYFKRVIHDEYKLVLNEIVKDIYKDFKLYVDFGDGIFNDNLNKNTKVEDIYDIDNSLRADIRILVKESSISDNDVTEKLKEIAQRMAEKKLVGTIETYLVFNDKFEGADIEMTYKLPTEVKDIFMEGSRKYIRIESDLGIGEVENG
ncbi:MAG: hypothetical protein GX660_07550 [Clostridiaceae bacterium]|nr:hypothetical protein [Clostridiaceae bacterium]